MHYLLARGQPVEDVTRTRFKSTLYVIFASSSLPSNKEFGPITPFDAQTFVKEGNTRRHLLPSLLHFDILTFIARLRRLDSFLAVDNSRVLSYLFGDVSYRAYRNQLAADVAAADDTDVLCIDAEEKPQDRSADQENVTRYNIGRWCMNGTVHTNENLFEY